MTREETAGELLANVREAALSGEVLELPDGAMLDGPAAVELHAWQAFASDQHAIACLELQAAMDGYRAADDPSADVLVNVERELRGRHFAPFASDDDLVRAVGSWLRARVAEARQQMADAVAKNTDPPAGSGVANELLRRWLLRLKTSHEQGVGLRIHELSRALGLNGLDQRWLLAATALVRDQVAQRSLREWYGFDGRVTAGLFGWLLAEDEDVERSLIGRLTVERPLIRHRLVYLNTPGERPLTGPRNCWFELDGCVDAALEGRPWWPPGIDGLVTLIRPDEVEPSLVSDKLYNLARSVERLQALKASDPDGAVPSIAVCGASGAATRSLARSAARRLERPILEVAAYWLFNDPSRFEHVFRLVVREAQLRGALIFVDGERQWEDEPRGAREVLASIARSQQYHGLPVLFDAATEGDEVLRSSCPDLYEVRLLPPTLDEQVALWDTAIRRADLPPLSEKTLTTEVIEGPIDAEDIERAVRLARNQAWLSAGNGKGVEVSGEALRAMAASKKQRGLHGIAQKVGTTLTWNDVVLPDEVLATLMEIITYARYQRHVFDEWGFGAKLPYGRSNSGLFTGPPGTGKTMVAGIIARELGMDLYRVDVSQIVSKYIGETEKNLARIFDEASRSHVVLLFDEADSLFAKRTAVKSSHDRYSNLEVNYLLQRIEMYDGVTVLTSNFPENIDDAFARRIRFKVEFPFPDAEERAKLWRIMVPEAASLSGDIDWSSLGDLFELAGGNIKNAVVRAAFMAAEQGSSINQDVLEQAALAEYREMGKLVRLKDGKPWKPKPRKDEEEIVDQ